MDDLASDPDLPPDLAEAGCTWTYHGDSVRGFWELKLGKALLGTVWHKQTHKGTRTVFVPFYHYPTVGYKPGRTGRETQHKHRATEVVCHHARAVLPKVLEDVLTSTPLDTDAIADGLHRSINRGTVLGKLLQQMPAEDDDAEG